MGVTEQTHPWAIGRQRALSRLADMYPHLFQRLYVEELSKLGASPRRRLQHGTRSCYNAGCRRPECREAANEYARQRRRAS